MDDASLQLIVFGMQVTAGGFLLAMAGQRLDHHQVTGGFGQMAGHL